MKTIFAFLALLLFPIAAYAQPANLDFEAGAPGEPPPAWIIAKGYEAQTVEGGAKQGTKFARLTRMSGVEDASPFGNAMQSIDATPHRGKWVRLRAAVRAGEGSAQLWLRVDRPDQVMGFFDNMGNRPVTSPEWTYVEITGDVASDAVTLNFGMILNGRVAMLDDVTLTDLGKVEAVAPEGPRALTERGLANVVAFTRLFGYVRHFHPSDQAASAAWDRVAVEGVRAVESAKNAEELARKLETFFRPLAPTVAVFPTAKPPRRPAAVTKPEGAHVLTWHHRGFGQEGGGGVYASERVQTDAVDPAKPFEASLGAGVSARIPLAVFATSGGTLPAVAAKQPPLPMTFTAEDRATRLAGVVILWNVLQHFYPYFDVVRVDWNQTLRATLTRAATDKSELEFLATLRYMMAAIQDGHGFVSHGSERGGYVPPLLFSVIEGKLVVTYVADESIGLKAGDVIDRVNGKPSADALREQETMISSATPQWKRYRAIEALRAGAQDSELSLGVGSRTVTVKRTLMPTIAEPRPPKVHEIEPGIFYLDLTRMEDNDFEEVLPKLASARGVIFDMRGYPRVGPTFLRHLSDQPMQSARWNIPIVTRPDHEGMTEFDTRGRWDLQPLTPRIGGRIVFLTDGRAISYAESVMGIVEHYRLGEILGEPTAGTNGNVNPVALPGGYRVAFTGMKVLKHDGSRHHGVGIQPTIPLSRTLKGVREGRDEQLERAVTLLSSASREAHE